MSLLERQCPACGSDEYKRHTNYTVQGGEERTIYHCPACDHYFSETQNTPLAELKTSLSRISQVLNAVNDGMGINAACRTFQVGKQTIRRWLQRLGDLRETLLVYALCHQFIQLLVEGDELYTKVSENKPAVASEGWTIVLMERASRFSWELDCGQRETALFEAAMQTLAQVIEQTHDLTRLTDGERRYANLLFDLCQTVVRTGQVGRPKKRFAPVSKYVAKTKAAKRTNAGANRPRIKRPNPNILQPNRI
jgi:transposase-like protein